MQCLVILHLGRIRVFFNVSKISKVDHSDLFLIRDTHLPQDKLGTKI